ncbi:MAG: hypothetical protein ACYTDT_11310 [Planctomycetota bacterium]|jgi:hypothetical protein
MADSQTIERVVADARKQWLNTAVVNSGAKLALVPSASVAFVCLVLLAGDWIGLVGVVTAVCIGFVLVVAVLVKVRQVFATPRSEGAPDWALLLDRALDGKDSIPAWLEAPATFKPAIAAQIVARANVSLGQSRNWSNLLLILVLLALPFAVLGWKSAAEDPTTETVANHEQATESKTDTTNQSDSSGEISGEGDAGTNATSSEDTADGDGRSEDVKRESSDGSVEGNSEQPATAPEQPDEVEDAGSATGDNNGAPPLPEPETGEPEDVDPNHVTPESRDGDTIKRERSKWIYDPDGSSKDDVELKRPSNSQVLERALKRTATTNKERTTLNRLFKKLYR